MPDLRCRVQRRDSDLYLICKRLAAAGAAAEFKPSSYTSCISPVVTSPTNRTHQLLFRLAVPLAVAKEDRFMPVSDSPIRAALAVTIRPTIWRGCAAGEVRRQVRGRAAAGKGV
jgi:hypothetical protein